MNYQSKNKSKCDFDLFFIFNDLSVIENGGTSLCRGNFELIRVSISYGISDNLEIEFGSEKGGHLTIKYDLDNREPVGWKRSIMVGLLSSEQIGHAGAKIQEAEDCGFLGWLCMFFSDPQPAIYEYHYQADINGLLIGYYHGYQDSPGILAYLGATYIDYRIKYSLDDNIPANIDQSHELSTDVLSLWIGTKIQIGKSDKRFVTMNYDFYKDSTRHEGELQGRLNFVFTFVY